jgi:FdhD protein
MPRDPRSDAREFSLTDDLVDAVEAVSVTRFARAVSGGSAAASEGDVVAREEPLEIQLGGTPLAVVMRTPGHDEELALGFLVTERVVRGPGDVLSVRHSSVARTPEAAGNVVRAILRPGLVVDLESLRRNLYASSSCGLCGKATLENALASAPPISDPARFPAGLLLALPDRLRAGQDAFARTGGLHAAALVAPGGELLVVREDVGRHNAVDKTIGWAAREGRLPLAGHVLLVSGRISWEIAQKALCARIPLVAAVSAPTSLAVQLAEAAGLTLVGFLRAGGFNVYGRRDRVVAEDA